jgi:hypothetical protein
MQKRHIETTVKVSSTVEDKKLRDEFYFPQKMRDSYHPYNIAPSLRPADLLPQKDGTIGQQPNNFNSERSDSKNFRDDENYSTMMLYNGKYNSRITKGGDNDSTNGGILKNNKSQFIQPTEIGSSSFLAGDGSPTQAGRSSIDENMILPQLKACNYKLRLQRAKLKTLTSNQNFKHYNQKSPAPKMNNPKSHKKLNVYIKNEIILDE